MFLFSGLWLIFVDVPQVYGAEAPVLEQVQHSQKTFSLAGEVFIHFAKEELGAEGMGQMGARWGERIIKSTKSWSVKDAQGFLRFLNQRIGREDTIKRIKSVSYFQLMSFTSFINRVSFYEEYLGEEGITTRLRRSLGGFHKGDPEEIRKVVKYVEEYIGEEAVKEAMKSNLEAFSRLPSSTLLKR